VNGEMLLQVEYNVEDHSETVFDCQHSELLLIHYDLAGHMVRVTPQDTHLDPLNVTYDRQGRWTQWTRGDLTVSRVFDEQTGRLLERQHGGRTAYQYAYRNTSKASVCSFFHCHVVDDLDNFLASFSALTLLVASSGL